MAFSIPKNPAGWREFATHMRQGAAKTRKTTGEYIANHDGEVCTCAIGAVHYDLFGEADAGYFDVDAEIERRLDIDLYSGIPMDVMERLVPEYNNPDHLFHISAADPQGVLPYSGVYLYNLIVYLNDIAKVSRERIAEIVESIADWAEKQKGERIIVEL